ncbi:hypothetical protein CAPTEDRAFT_228632 [Capitella teleta]|uniref:Uncharacterized protein n=1 Tax=Capitella teleta TaxID=283909 RepID=R7UG99_CAPTE|nr:hypothetical protein CAPTEDRAFT_228632 [Capitella teleta]|eukprot:ELU05098.1 hypothetical protein CAPTEDRAFT_228632 [Capitella teleta]
MTFMPQSGVPGYCVPGQVQMPLVDGSDAPIGSVYFYNGDKDDPRRDEGSSSALGPEAPLTQKARNDSERLEGKPPNYRAVSIATCLLCNPIFGCFAILLSVWSDRAYSKGDTERARNLGTMALGAVVASIIVTITLLVLIITLTELVYVN